MNTQTQARAIFHNDASTDLQWRIRGEYREMPGLRLSLDQATRLWALDRAACGVVLDTLVGANFLQRDRDGLYMRRNSGYERNRVRALPLLWVCQDNVRTSPWPGVTRLRVSPALRTNALRPE